MNAQQIVSALSGHKGQHIQVTWSRPAKVGKDCPLVIVKRTSAFVRAGIDYSNLASVKSAVANGEREEPQGLPWGTWQTFPFTIEHKGKEYVRLYPASFANLTPTVEWSIDGKPATFEQVSPFLLASEKRSQTDDKPECFTVCADSIVSIG